MHINSTLHLLHLFNYVVYVVVFPDPLVGLHFFVVVVVIIVVHIVEYHNLHIEENHQVLICCATS